MMADDVLVPEYQQNPASAHDSGGEARAKAPGDEERSRCARCVATKACRAAAVGCGALAAVCLAWLLAYWPPAVLPACTAARTAAEVANGDFVVPPSGSADDYCADPDLLNHQGNPKGKGYVLSLPLSQSDVYGNPEDGYTAEDLLEEREIYVYVPAAYEDGSEAGLLVLQDGPGMASGFPRNAVAPPRFGLSWEGNDSGGMMGGAWGAGTLPSINNLMVRPPTLANFGHIPSDPHALTYRCRRTTSARLTSRGVSAACRCSSRSGSCRRRTIARSSTTR